MTCHQQHEVNVCLTGAAGRPVAVLKSSSAQDLPADVKQLCAWGYPQQAAAHALSQANGNLIMALCSLYAQLTKQQVQVQGLLASLV